MGDQLRKRVVVTGMGVVSPVGIGRDIFWKNLLSGKSGIRRITYFDPTEFDSQVAGQVPDEFDASCYIPKKELRRTDRFIQFAIWAAMEASKDAGFGEGKVDRNADPNRCGVIIGSGIGGIQTLEREFKVLLNKGPSRISPFTIPMMIVNLAAGHVSIYLGLKGPNTCVSTACATGTHAIGDAFRLIQLGYADVMFAGGSEAAITPLGIGGFCALKALSTRNDEPEKSSRPFDAQRDGFVMGEGAGIVVLEELEHAKRRGAKIYAEVVGYAMTGDAYHITAPDPQGDGGARAMALAIEDAGIKPEDINYINAHGTSTKLNDKLETLAIKKVFGDHANKLAISSTKSMTGHLLGAAGAIEFVATVMSVYEDKVAPTINYEFPDPDCDLDYVPNKMREIQVNFALSNSLGFGGHNATIIVKKFVE